MHLTKEQLQGAGIDPGKIQKFAELFPYGTEVTCELCARHPDVFSFGKQGRELICATYEEVRLQYDSEIIDADLAYGARRAIAISVFRRRMMQGDDNDKARMVYYPLGTDEMTAQVVISRPPTINEDNTHKHNIERIEQEHLLDLALLFYKSSKSLSFCRDAY